MQDLKLKDKGLKFKILNSIFKIPNLRFFLRKTNYEQLSQPSTFFSNNEQRTTIVKRQPLTIITLSHQLSTINHQT